jgi:hypothetical protein
LETYLSIAEMCFEVLVQPSVAYWDRHDRFALFATPWHHAVVGGKACKWVYRALRRLFFAPTAIRTNTALHNTTFSIMEAAEIAITGSLWPPGVCQHPLYLIGWWGGCSQ